MTASSDPIRVGIIRCDSHAMFYALLMDHANPDRLRAPEPAGSTLADGWWPNGAAHRFFYTNPGDPTQMTVGRVDGFRVTKVWDENQPTAELFASVFDGRPAVCDSFDQVSDDVDLVFIADCNFDGADHVELAKPGLQKGVATFVDKPFGGTFSNGNMLVELAKKYSAPIHTDSIMTAMPATEQFITRLAEIGGADYLAIEGSGDATAGLIHSISLAQHIFGPDVVDVRALVGKTQKYILLDYHGESVKNGVGITCGVGGPYSGMYAHAFSEHGCVEAVFNDFKYTFGAKHIVEQIRDMVRSGETSRPHIDAMLAALRTLDTVHRALQCAP